MWIDKPSTQLIMDELGSHIDDTLFFGQMNVGDTLRFFLRSPNIVVSGMNLYPIISTYERMMPGGEIFMCRLDFEDWTDQLFDDVSIEIYLQPDSGAYAGPIAIFFEPEQIGPDDTTKITFKYRHLNGTLEDIDSLRTFEVGLLDGCTLGILKTETDSGVYISSTYQPLYFIADSSADSGTVIIRAGLIDEGGSSKMISGNLEQKTTTETKTAKRYDVIINKNTPNGYAQRNNNQVLGDNPGSEFCHLEYYTQTFGRESFVVGDKCGAGAPPCSMNVESPLGFKEDVVEWTGNYVFYKEGFHPETLKISSGGLTYFLWDGNFNMVPITEQPNDRRKAVKLEGSFYGPYKVETCFTKNLNNGIGTYQYSFTSVGETDNYIHKPIIIQVADYTKDPYEIKSESGLATIPFDSTFRALIDFEYNRYRAADDVDNFFDKYDVLYGIVDVYWEHEKYHKRDVMRMLNENYDKELLQIVKPDGHFISKTLKKHLQTTFNCSDFIKNYTDAKRIGEKYFADALKEYQNYFKENWYKEKVYIYEFSKWYNKTELYTHWSNSVQKKITRYQSLLESRPGFDPKPYQEQLKEIKKLWEPFKKYRNSL